MEHKRKKTETLDSLYRSQKSEVGSQMSDVFCPLSSVFCLEVLLFAYLTIFIFGCDESLQPATGDFYVSKNKTPWSKALRITQESLVDSNSLVRMHAIEVVASTGQLRFMPTVHRLLRDKSIPVRFASALAIGDLKYSPAKSTVAQLLEDTDSNVVIAAAYAMSKLGSAEYFEAVRKALGDNDQKLRANAALLLGKSGDASSLKLLWQTMQDKDSDDRVVYQSAEAIAMLGDERIYPKLWTMLISAYHDVRTMGVIAMGKLGTPDAKNALIRMLDDDILEVRLEAAKQLGVFRDPIGEAVVLDVFEKNLISGLDKQAAERANVLTALAIGQIRTPTLRRFLPQLLQNESKLVRIAAAKAVFLYTK